MKILRKKNIIAEASEEKELQPAEVELEPVVDHTTANTLASKEANEKAAEENVEASGIKDVAKEVVDEIQDPKKDTPAPKTPSLKPYTEAKQVVDRKALGALIKECKDAGRKYRVKKSLEEGFRYVFEEFEDDYPECYFVCHSDEDANNENGYFDTLEDAKAYAEAHPEICCIFKVCGNEEEKVYERPLEECNKQEVKEDVEEEVIVAEEELPETFEGKMDFLAADEDEAIAGYEKILPLIEEESVKEQLSKILEEEKAHKAFLEAVKEDHSLVYSHEEAKEEESEPELVAQEADVEVVEESKEEDHAVCPKCGKEAALCECDKAEIKEEVTEEKSAEETITEEVVKEEAVEQTETVTESTEETKTEEQLEEAIVAPVSEPGDEVAVPAADIVGEIKVEEQPADDAEVAVVEITPELDPEAEIEIDSIETFEPTDEIGKKTMTTIKDAGEGAMFAFKDTLKDLFNLKIKVSDLQQLLSSSSDWLLDLLGFNEPHEEEIHSEELPEEPVSVEEPEIVGGEFDDVEPVTDLSTIDINDFDEVDPVEYEDEDEKFFVED